MSKYYKVYLECESFCMVCKKVPFTKNIYQEIITDKIIYPSSKKTANKLTYGYLPNGIPRCYEITNCCAKEWLRGLNVEDYTYNLQRLEDIITSSSKIEIEEKIIYKKQEKLAGKSIKRTLRKIRAK